MKKRIKTEILVLLFAAACGTTGTSEDQKIQQISGTSPFVRFQGDQSGISVVFGAILFQGDITNIPSNPTVLKDASDPDSNQRYKMWYNSNSFSDVLNQISSVLSGTSSDLTVITSRIGYATSPIPQGAFNADGIYVGWTDQGPVLTNADIPGFSDAGDGISDPMVVQLPDGFWMFFTGTNDGTSAIYQAFSTDGASWTLLDGDTHSVATLDPILSPGSQGSWDGGSVSAPSCMIDGSILRCWYAGHDGNSDNEDPFYGIGYAECALESGVGITDQPCAQSSPWVKLSPSASDAQFSSSNPLFASSRPILAEGPTGTFDSAYIGDPTVLLDATAAGDRVFKLWYVGGSEPLIPFAPSTLNEFLALQENIASTNLGIGVASTFEATGKSQWERFEFSPVATELSLPVSVGDILCETFDLETLIEGAIDTSIEIIDQILQTVVENLAFDFFDLCEMTTLEEALNQDERGPSIFKEGDQYYLYLSTEFSLLSKFNFPLGAQLAANPPIR
ncbi:MAG: hypothetical protein HY538_04520 [Deltaproteobacteria bacterium]|nr:hypothetical protein [Deltaproteobacteria bacterium]